MDTFRIGARKGDHVEVRIARTDDALEARFAIVAAGLREADEDALRAGDLARFRDALTSLDEGGSVDAEIHTQERSLQVRVSRTGGGHQAECVAMGNGGNLLKLVVRLDGPQLAELIWALEGIVRDVGDDSAL